MGQSNNSSKVIVRKSIDTFRQINKKINYLLKNSSDDFISLNTVFKRYHDEINAVHENNELVIRSFKAVLQLSNFDEKLNEIENDNKLFKEEITLDLSVFNKLKKNLKSIVIHANNINQDVATLRLLVTNLRFDPGLKVQHKEIINYLDDITACTKSLSSVSSKLINDLDKHLDFLNNQSELLLTQFESITQIVNDTFKTEIKNIGNIENLLSIIDEIHNERTNSTSDIITNLQYEDIIRQRIEHVQSAQYKILEKLEQHVTNPKEIVENELLMQVRDIGTLQAAQLIHANQEYQNAVKRIITRFNELEIILNKAIKYWKSHFKPLNIKINKVVSLMREKLPQLQSEVASIMHSSKHLSNDFVETIKDFNIKFKETDSFSCTKEKIDKVLEKVIGLKKKMAKTHNSLEQFIEEIDRLKLSIKEIDKIKYNTELLCNEFEPAINKKDWFLSIDKLLGTTEDNISEALSNELQKTYSSSFIEFKESDENNIQFNLNDITYYVEFEKGVDEIIDLLNELIIEMNIKGIQGINKETVEDLKSLYTMESEREIHESLTENKKKKQSTANEKSDDDIEFFTQ